MRQFLVVAIPSQDRSLEEFQADLDAKIKGLLDISLRISVHESTRLVDQDDLGDCFLVGLYVEDDDDDDDDDMSNDFDVTAHLDPKAEVWVTSNESIPLAPTYGWEMEDFLSESSDSETICDRLQQYGLAIVKPNQNQQHEQEESTDDVFAGARKQLLDHVARLEDTVRRHHKHIQLEKSAFGFKEYTHRGPGRFEVLFDPDGELYRILREAFEPQWIDSICQHLQSERSHLRLNISCVYSRPGATDQDWHTDGDHYSDQAYAVCVFAPLIPLTADTGYTRFWPKSHLYRNLLGLAQAADALQATMDGVELQPGDYVMYDYTTWHKGVGNTSDQERPIVQFLYSCDWYKERKNYGTRSVFEIVDKHLVEQ